MLNNKILVVSAFTLLAISYNCAAENTVSSLLTPSSSASKYSTAFDALEHNMGSKLTVNIDKCTLVNAPTNSELNDDDFHIQKLFFNVDTGLKADFSENGSRKEGYFFSIDYHDFDKNNLNQFGYRWLRVDKDQALVKLNISSVDYSIPPFFDFYSWKCKLNAVTVK